jgi:hypothetical protein
VDKNGNILEGFNRNQLEAYWEPFFKPFREIHEENPTLCSLQGFVGPIGETYLQVTDHIFKVALGPNSDNLMKKDSLLRMRVKNAVLPDYEAWKKDPTPDSPFATFEGILNTLEGVRFAMIERRDRFRQTEKFEPDSELKPAPTGQPKRISPDTTVNGEQVSYRDILDKNPTDPFPSAKSPILWGQSKQRRRRNASPSQSGCPRKSGSPRKKPSAKAPRLPRAPPAPTHRATAPVAVAALVKNSGRGGRSGGGRGGRNDRGRGGGRGDGGRSRDQGGRGTPGRGRRTN